MSLVTDTAPDKGTRGLVDPSQRSLRLGPALSFTPAELWVFPINPAKERQHSNSLFKDAVVVGGWVIRAMLSVG